MATMLGKDPEDAPQPDLPEDEAAQSSVFEFTWQDLRSCTRYINDKGWSQAPIPAILEIVPENIVVSRQLQQILLWSLQRFDETPPQDQQRDVGQPDGASEPSSSGRTSMPSGENTVPAASKADGSEESEEPATPSRMEKRKSVSLMTRLKQLRQDVANKRSSVDGSGARTGSTRPPAQQVSPNGECISCFDEFPRAELVHLTCSHDYCKSCLREVVLNAMKNESLFPPKCCLTEMPLKTVLVCLENKQREEYKEKSAEYAIPAGHRWYCPEPTCSKWIRPERLHRNRRERQTCPFCKASICSTCRSLAHDENQDCPQDFGLESTLEVAESEGWRRCYSCRTMVELTTGCRHITCRCGAEFCYVCNARWRTCNCTEADKERRIRELRAQREQRAQMEEEEVRRREAEDEAARIEAEEMAEAIRQVEELERQEAIRRVEEERQRQLEEELILAQLEEARLLEEIARREEEEEAERQFREILITSSKEECQAMMKTLMQIINYQHATLMSNHAAQEQNLAEEKEFRLAQQTSKCDLMFTWLRGNIDKRMLALHSRQQSEWETLLRETEDEEDSLFMEMYMYLRNKPNREQREKQMRDTFQKQQTERTSKLQQKHQDERNRFEVAMGFEMEGLRKAISLVKPDEAAYETALEKFGIQVGSDRQWFQTISSRRINMLNEHRKIVLQQLQAEEDPTGLAGHQARLITPAIPTFDDCKADSPRTDLTALEGLPSTNDETSDLYNATAAGPGATAAPSSLGRSDTVTRSIPGAFPTSSSSMTQKELLPSHSSLTTGMMTTPTPPSVPSTAAILPSPVSTSSATPLATSASNQPASPGSSQGSIMNRPRPRRPVPSYTPTTPATSSHPLSSFPPTTNTITSNPFNPFVSPSTATLSTTHPNTSTSAFSARTTATATSSHTSKHSHNSSTSTSTSSSSSSNTDDVDADALDSISANIIAKHGGESANKKKTLTQRLRGLGKRKEISEEEIRRRMSTRAVVGDGWSAL